MDTEKKDRERDAEEAPANDHKQSKETRKSGLQAKNERLQAKNDRAKGSISKPNSWVKKAGTDIEDDFAATPDKKDDNHDRNGRDKAREKKENWKDRGDKKDTWKERRRKQDKPEEVNKEAVDNALSNQPALNGGALLSMLKANPPVVTRYTRAELLAIGQLPASKVKPRMLSTIIDKENSTSPLLMTQRPAKADKAQARADDEAEELGGNHRGEHPERSPPSAPQDSQWDMPDMNNGIQGNLLEFTLGDIRQAEKSISSGMSMKDYKASLRTGAAELAALPAKEREDPFKADGGEDAPFFTEEDEDVSRASRGFGKWFGRGAEPNALSGVAGGAAEQLGFGSPPPVPPPPFSTLGPPSPPGGAFASEELPARGPGSGETLSELLGQKPAGMAARLPPPPPPPAAWGMPRQAASPDGRLSSGQAQARAGAGAAEASGSNAASRSILSMLGRTDLADSGASADALAATDAEKQGKLSVAELFHLAQGKELPPIPPCTGTGSQAGGAARRNNGAGAEADMESRMQREVLLKMAASQYMWQQAAAAKAQQPPAMPPGSRFPGYQPGPGGPPPTPPPRASFGGALAAGAGGPRAGATVAGAATAAGIGRGGAMGMNRGQGDPQLLHEVYAQAQAMMGKGGYPTAGGGKGGATGAAQWPSPMAPGYPPFAPRGGPGYGCPAPYGSYPVQPDFSQFMMGGVDGGAAQVSGFGPQGSTTAAAAAAVPYGRLPEGAESTASAAGRGRGPAVQASSARSWSAEALASSAPGTGGPPAGAGLSVAAALGAVGGPGGTVPPAGHEGQTTNEEDAGCSQS